MLFCGKCRRGVKSDVYYEMGRGSYAVMIFLLVLLVTAFLAFLPCVLKECKDVKHRCPKCLKLLGTKEFLCG